MDNVVARARLRSFRCSRCRMLIDEDHLGTGGDLLGTREVFNLCDVCEDKLEEKLGRDPVWSPEVKQFGLVPYFDFFTDEISDEDGGRVKARKDFRRWLREGRMSPG